MTTKNPVRTVKATITLEAQQFFHGATIPPGVIQVDDYDPISRTAGRAYFITTGGSNGAESWRLNDGDWVVWNPLEPQQGYGYYTDEQFQARFQFIDYCDIEEGQ